MKRKVLTRAKIVSSLHARIGMSKQEGAMVVSEVFESISRVLADGRRVKISGFGNFEHRDKGERPGRNPRTGESIPISVRRVVTFSAGPKLRQLVEAGAGSDRLGS